MRKRVLGIVLFSVIEVAGLAGWLLLADMGHPIRGIVVLLVALIVEHIVTDNVLHGRPLFGLDSLEVPALERLPLGEIIVFSAIETGIWAAWLALWNVNAGGATVFLAVALLIEHTISKNVHERRGIFDKIIDLGTIPHTAVEVASCDVWLVLARLGNPLLAVASLLFGSLLEHSIAISKTGK